ncbi:MAG: hypothetical protein K5793_03770 [Nitrosarchaeum sp.]|nr:hypothetical protein [Nitrosarchaeum sp.]
MRFRFRTFIAWLRHNRKDSERIDRFLDLYDSDHEFHYGLRLSGTRKLLGKKRPELVEDFDVLVGQFFHEKPLQLVRYQK